MKRRLVLTVFAAVAAAALAALSAGNRGARQPPPEPRPGARNAIEVSALAGRPQSHLGEVLVAGVVGRVEGAASLVVLVDRVEFGKCGLACEDEAGTRVPVRWSGPLPRVGEEVLMQGRLTKAPAGLILTGRRAPETAGGQEGQP